jgi:hypothetical protein
MNTNKFLLTLSFSFLCLSVFAQLNLIPQPQKVEQQNGFFEIKKNISLISNYPSNHQNQELVRWFNETLGIEFSKMSRIAKNNIQLLRQPNRSSFKNFLEQEELDTDFTPEQEGYVLQVTPNSIKLILRPYRHFLWHSNTKTTHHGQFQKQQDSLHGHLRQTGFPHPRLAG